MSSGKKFQKFEEFLVLFVRELNQLADEGGVVLVEGKRDVLAMRNLGYRGRLVSVAPLRRRDLRDLLRRAKTVVILTDLDREGRQLAARYTKLLAHDRIESSLEYRKRLLVASRGVFPQVENLSRFAHLNGELLYQ